VFCLFCNVYALRYFHLHMVFVFWFRSCVLGLDSYAIANELALDGKHYVRMVLFCLVYVCG
jgi:hypothetical protein